MLNRPYYENVEIDIEMKNEKIVDLLICITTIG